MLEPVLIFLAAIAFLAIALEDVIHINKAKSTLFLGTLCWLLLFVADSDHPAVEYAFSENILDIASLWLFLFAAMTFVAYLNQHGMVEKLVAASERPDLRYRVTILNSPSINAFWTVLVALAKSARP